MTIMTKHDKALPNDNKPQNNKKDKIWCPEGEHYQIGGWKFMFSRIHPDSLFRKTDFFVESVK